MKSTNDFSTNRFIMQRLTEAERFFNLLFGNVTDRKFGYLWAKQGDSKQTIAFDVSTEANRADMARKAIELNDDGFDVYFGVNLVDVPPESYERAKHEKLTLQTAIITDIDVVGGTHVDGDKKKYPPDFDTAKNFLPFTPSILVDSGYGLHGYNVFAEPVAITNDNREAAKARNVDYISAIRTRAGVYAKAVDGIGDLARVLRVPGTFNYKLGRDNAPMCHIVDVNDVRFTPDAIDTKLAELRAETEQPKLDMPARKPHKTQQRDFDDDDDFKLYRARRMLDFIPPSSLTYDDWFAIGAALKNVGCTCSDWENWSRPDDRFKDGECEAKWQGLNRGGYDIGTLYYFAVQGGYDAQEIYREWYKVHPDSKPNDRADLPTDDEQAAPMDDDDTADDMEAYLHGFATDLGNAERLERFCGKVIRWLTDEEKWLIWQDGGIWKLKSEKNSCLNPFVKQLAEKLAKHSRKLRKNKDDKSQERAKSFYGLSVAFQKAKHVNPAIFMLKGFDSILITREDLDKHRHLINCLNGVVDLREGTLYPHRAADLITQQTRAEFRPNYRNPIVDNFLTSIMPNEETRQALLRWLAYCLTGEISEQCAHFWTGGGSNGKSTVIDFLLYLMGDYATKLPVAAVVESREAEANATTTHLNCLVGKRLAVVNEFKPNHRLDVQQFKDLTGDRFLDIRRLHHERETVEMQAKLVLNGNELPRLTNADSYALSRRIRALRFEQTFSVERGNLDPTLPKKLATPDALAGMLSVLVPHAVSWYRAYDTGAATGLIEATAMREAKTDYLCENDFIEEFISERCVFVTTAETPLKDFETRLRAIYPAETNDGRIRKKDLRALIQSKLETHGATIVVGRGREKFIKGVGWLLDDEFNGTPIDPRDIP